MKRALVTGSTRGIGEALVHELVKRDFVVYAAMRDVNLSPFDNKNVQPIVIDVRDDESIKLAAKTVELDGSLDLLINNAGVFSSTTPGSDKAQLTELAHLSRDALITMLDINTLGPLMISKFFAPIMNVEGSLIMNITSDQGSFQTKGSSANYGYRSSKVALNMITQSLAYDLPKNVSVCAIHPGWVKTENNPKGVISPQESAKRLVGALDSWDNSKNGAYLDLDGSHFPL